MHKYQGLSYQQLVELPMQNIADKNCALFLWSTGTRMNQATKLIEAWGWRYVTVAFIWIKTSKDNLSHRKLPGYYLASNPEYVLLGMRGRLEVQNQMTDPIFYGPVLKPHSRKPEEIIYRIERIFGDIPRIELFARTKDIGWDATGLEYDGVDIKDFLIG